MRICPSCKTPFEDDVENCPDDGAILLEEAEFNERQASAGAFSVQAGPAERTSMIDLEALEAKRAARRAEQPEAPIEHEEPREEYTAPPDGTMERDVDATGTLQKSRLRKKTRMTQAGTRGATSVREPTQGTRSQVRSGTKAGSQLGQPGLTKGDGARGTQLTSQTRRTQLQSQKRPLSATTAMLAALSLVGALLGGIIIVSRMFAVLTVTTVPPGAEVRLDGEVIGTSPLQKRIRVGTHAIDLLLADYEPFKEVVDVPAAGLPFLQPLQKRAPPQAPPPTAQETADGLLRHAQQLFDAGDVEGAKNLLEEALRLVPGHPGVLALLKQVDAEIALRAKAFEVAQGNAAAQENVQRARALLQEGKRAYDRDDVATARTKLYAAMRLDPQYPEPHRWLARVFVREGDDAKVRYHLERYLQLGGADADFKVREWLKAHPR